MQKLVTLIILCGSACATKFPLTKRELTKSMIAKQRSYYENLGKNFLGNDNGADLPLKDLSNTQYLATVSIGTPP